MSSEHIVIVAGELSGDEHGADLVKALRKQCPEVRISGMGGRYLRAAGMEIVVDSEKSASVMAFKEVAASIQKLYGAYAALQKHLKEARPEVLVLIDFPDFNLRLARYAKKIGIKVFYYITPQIWAWRKHRVREFKRYVDRAACIFPFEREFFETHGYARSVYVGHPFAIRHKGLAKEADEKRLELKREFGLRENDPVLAIFPGSRNQEIALHIDFLANTWRQLKEKHPQLQALVSLVPSVDPAAVIAKLGTFGDVRIVNTDSLRVLQAADAGLIKSGTSNLQAAYCGLPFAMFFKTAPLSALIARLFLKIREFSIINVIRSGSIKEFVQDGLDPDAAAREVEALLFDPMRRSQVLSSLKAVTDALEGADDEDVLRDRHSAADRTASLTLECLNWGAALPD